jgi:hypothetical protein
MVTTTVFELLVGAACIRRGLTVQMFAEDRARKVPDYRIEGLGVPKFAYQHFSCSRRR